MLLLAPLLFEMIAKKELMLLKSFSYFQNIRNSIKNNHFLKIFENKILLIQTIIILKKIIITFYTKT